MSLLVGPRDLRVETDLISRHPIAVRPAYRVYDMSGPFDAWREFVADLLPEHPLDVRIVRMAYRALRRFARFADGVLFGGEHDREVEWTIGLSAVGVLFFIIVRMLR